ncbi:MAG: hypothetical protein AB1324_03645 [Candidatus Micrarchaeota archaeon]
MFMNRAVTAVSLLGGVLAIIISLVYGNPLLPIAAAVFFTLTLLLWKYGYLIIPVFTKATNVVEVHAGYEVPPTRDYIIKKNENGYFASKFLEVRFYESSMDKSADEKRTMFDSFEKAVSSLKYIVKVTLMISTLDLSKHIDEIKTKRGAVEAKKAKESKIALDENMRMDRELAYWNRLLDRITQGERPVEVIAFASTTAFGLTRDEALSRVSRQSKELRTILSSSLGCDVRELSDLEMLKCFEWDFFFPTTQEEIRDALF